MGIDVAATEISVILVMSRTNRVIHFARKVNWRKRLVIAAAVIGVLSAAVLLIRDSANVANDFSPAPGSLVVNINTATQEQLETIPGVGPSRAAQIIVGRPYESVEDLARIVGIGDESLEGLRPFVTTEGDTRKR